MLRIEKVHLQGFKSFCDPTELVFDEEGVTAVVGPNGCGKSNVADALSWVIGEQRAKALRGGKMEDVIFQGSRNRQPSGMAEVVLTMRVSATFEIRSSENNPEGAETGEAHTDQLTESVEAAPSTDLGEEPRASEEPPAQPEKQKKRRKHTAKSNSRVFQAGERITVARRLYRTGESEYEMNGRTCRLRDVQDLFAGTGLGGAHYAIIEQGRIGQVLSAKPLDRRALIEEAAGVSKFKLRQRAAELKLEASKQNLARLTDIITEVDRQQNSLKRQAARARRFKRLRQEMRDLMRAVYVADYRATRDTIAALDAKWNEVSERESQTLALIVNRESEQTQAAQLSREAEARLNEARQLAANADLETERARQQHAHLSEQLQSLGARTAQFERDRAAINERREFIEQESTRLRTELQHTEQEINAESAALAAEENSHRAQMEEDAEAERGLEAARRRVYESATHLERWRQLKRQFIESVERTQSKRQGLAAERERALEQAKAAEQEHSSVAAQLEESARQQQESSARLGDLEAALNEERRESAERQSALIALHRELTATEHRLKSLAELDERRAYFSEAVQTVMHRGQRIENGGLRIENRESRIEESDPQSSILNPPPSNFHTLGTLADFVHVAPEHEGMIEAGLRDELQYILVPSFDDALGAIDFLKTEGRGRATFMVVGLHGGESFRRALIRAFSSSEAEPESAPAEKAEAGSIAPLDAQHSQAAQDRGTQPPSLISLLGLRPEFEDAFRQALPGLANAVIVEDAERAIEGSLSSNGARGAGLVYLARTGERAVAGRIVSGGSGADKTTGVLALKREIAELHDRAEVLSATARTAEDELTAVNTKITHLDEWRATLDSQLRQVEKQLAVQREQLQQGERERARLTAYLRVVEKETAQIAQEHAEFESKLQHASAETEKAESDHGEAEQLVATAQTALADLRRSAEDRSQELSRRRADFAAKTERRRGLQNDIRRLENEANELHNRLNRSRLEALEEDERAQAAQTALASLSEQLESLTAQQQSHATELEQKTAALTEARERLDALELFLRELREAAMQAREERAQLEVERARLAANLEHLAEACRAELGENIAEVCARLAQAKLEASDEATPSDRAPATIEISASSSAESLATTNAAAGSEADDEAAEEAETELVFWQVPDDFDLAAAKARLDELRAKIDGLGPVNLMAIDEIEEVEERFSFLTTQKADIEKAIADTQAAIAEIKRRSRERFRDAFDAINTNFTQMFQELFGGGHGEMRLIDETDILESGIEIIAQPPGKRLQNILLLSGGEKAMAAMALVLAIFRYRPSPFCLLDEVDAPLDEVNIGRFVDKVLEMSRGTQFMIITHSKRTMEAARTLYGVTMEDPGVSKLVSVKLT